MKLASWLFLLQQNQSAKSLGGLFETQIMTNVHEMDNGVATLIPTGPVTM